MSCLPGSGGAEKAIVSAGVKSRGGLCVYHCACVCVCACACALYVTCVRRRARARARDIVVDDIRGNSFARLGIQYNN